MSEAIYLSDPDGNGIEVYRDRPLTEWEYKDGRIKMATDPFDFDGVMACAQAGGDWIGMTPGTVLGHMHLHVGDLETSAGGYHQLRINTWNGVGAPPAPDDALGLRYFSVILPDEEALTALNLRLKQADQESEEVHSRISVKDPAGNGIQFTSEAGS